MVSTKCHKLLSIWTKAALTVLAKAVLGSEVKPGYIIIVSWRGIPSQHTFACVKAQSVCVCVPSHLAVAGSSPPGSYVLGVGPQGHRLDAGAEVRAHRTQDHVEQRTGRLLHPQGRLRRHHQAGLTLCTRSRNTAARSEAHTSELQSR